MKATYGEKFAGQVIRQCGLPTWTRVRHRIQRDSIARDAW
jgi:hypothetical protein